MSDPILATAARMVVKSGLRLGLLTSPERHLALAIVWASLPPGECAEREINQRLQAVMAGPAAFLDTDHVELRRWLVDAGWLRRDGYGRAYAPTPLADVPADHAATAATLRALDLAAWVARERQRLQAARAEKHLAWQRARDDAQAAQAAGATTT